MRLFFRQGSQRRNGGVDPTFSCAIDLEIGLDGFLHQLREPLEAAFGRQLEQLRPLPVGDFHRRSHVNTVDGMHMHVNADPRRSAPPRY